MSLPEFEEIIEQNDQTVARREHLESLRSLICNAYPNKFVRSRLSGGEDTITAILDHGPVAQIAREMAEIRAALKEGERPPTDKKDALNERLKTLGKVRIAGRTMTPLRGNFVHLTDGISKLQIYCKKGLFALVLNDGRDTLDETNAWTAWQLIDHGDFIGVEGYLFVTNTGEVSVHVEKLQFLAKAMLPMPDKMHGIADAEIRQRQRYYDLIGSSLQVKSEPPASAGGQSVDQDSGPELTTREVFERRAKVISSVRHFLEDHGYIEVETPMLTPKATGAAAKPFKTHHNALDIDLYARIAPELYLKRLVVGGFEKVYELNRNFRNEGISYKHNPEFTMLEFYCAYMDVNGMMDFAEELLRQSVEKAAGTTKLNVKQVRGKVPMYVEERHGSRSEPRLNQLVTGIHYLNVYENEIDFSSFQRLTMKEAVVRYSSFAHQFIEGPVEQWLDEEDNVHILSQFLWWVDNELYDEVTIVDSNGDVVGQFSDEETHRIVENAWKSISENNAENKLTEKERALGLLDLFEDFVEEKLIQPTFVTDYPKSISPLSKADPTNPQVAERFELFINGMEVANGFSELNDPREQYDRFADQMKQREGGDEEAMVLDEDYIRALSYGMPPAAGIGIGIDRLVMLLTNKHSIRDVILFPHMRPERNQATEDTESPEGN